MKRIPYIISLACCLALTSTTHGQTATDTEATFELGRQMVQNRQFKKAAALLDSIAQLNISPDYKAKYLAINGILQRDSLHNTPKALEYFQKAESLYADIMKLRPKEIETSVVYASMGLGAQADSLKQYATAISHYEKAIDFISHLLSEGIRGANMSDFDLTVMQYSFEQSRAIDFGHNHQFEDAEAAFEELKYNYSQFELSPDTEMLMQGWLFGCICRQQYILMYEYDKQDITKALEETKALLEKLLRGLSNDNTAISEGLAYQMPMFLYHAARINLKAGNPEQAVKLCGNAMMWSSADDWKPSITNIKGEALLSQGKEDEARQCWEEVLKLNPHFYDNKNSGLVLNKKFGNK